MTWGFAKDEIEEAIADSLVSHDPEEVGDCLEAAWHAGLQSGLDYQAFQQKVKESENTADGYFYTHKPLEIRRKR